MKGVTKRQRLSMIRERQLFLFYFACFFVILDSAM